MLWELTNQDALRAVHWLSATLAPATQVRHPLEFNNMDGITNGFISETSDWYYIVVSREDGRNVSLYQMSTDEPLCPININRCERFERFTIEDSAYPLAAAFNAAQVWDDAVNGWEATHVSV